MTQSDLKDLAKQAEQAEKALKQAEAAAKAAKAALKAQRPSQMTLIRQAVITDEDVTTDDLLTTLAERGYANAKKDIVASYRSDALAFLRLLRDMGRLVEVEEEAEPETEDGESEEGGETEGASEEANESETADSDETGSETQQPQRRGRRRQANAADPQN